MALLVLTLALLAMTVATTAMEVTPLDMAPNSFDDRYRGCGPAMMEQLSALNRSEFQNNRWFAKAWPEAVAKWQNLGSPVSPLPSPAHAVAIVAYHELLLFVAFNGAVSKGGRSPREYRDQFRFKTLHFLLTHAVAALGDVQKEQKCRCVTFVDLIYKFDANAGDVVRLGRFALSSRFDGGVQNLGSPTVFRVLTCHGVDVTAFTGNPSAEEVLIPPFEQFKVTNVIDYGEKVEIHLDSIGTYSKYHCEWVTGGSVPRAPGHLRGLLLATTALAVATGIF
ncbi:NAR1 ribosyltransferase, partial [Copsychus sechellarum]|nr:NAR1 ribosyltransferase [Copsychus sechellarum]